MKGSLAFCMGLPCVPTISLGLLYFPGNARYFMVSGLKGKGVKDLVQYLTEQVFSPIPMPYLSKSGRHRISWVKCWIFLCCLFLQVKIWFGMISNSQFWLLVLLWYILRTGMLLSYEVFKYEYYCSRPH
jgi:hypothetical protein